MAHRHTLFSNLLQQQEFEIHIVSNLLCCHLLSANLQWLVHEMKTQLPCDFKKVKNEVEKRWRKVENDVEKRWKKVEMGENSERKKISIKWVGEKERITVDDKW